MGAVRKTDILRWKSVSRTGIVQPSQLTQPEDQHEVVVGTDNPLEVAEDPLRQEPTRL